MSKALGILIMFLKLTPLSDVADAIEKDMADGKISAHEAVDLVALATGKAEQFFPAQAAEIDLARDVAVAVSKFMTAKEAPPAPKA